ncbi:putative transposase-associated domain-containing protein [Tanacetum coccineum]
MKRRKCSSIYSNTGLIKATQNGINMEKRMSKQQLPKYLLMLQQKDLDKFQELLLDAEKPLYKGCPDFTKLSVIFKLLNLKGKYEVCDKFFTEITRISKKCYLCNNCILYWKDNKELTVCPTCGILDGKVDNKSRKGYRGNDIDVFLSISEDLRWHATRRITDGVLRHLADSQAWLTIVLWTINDYHALGTLCGCPYSGFKGCVGKGKRTNNKTLENQEDTRGRGGKIQKQKRKTTEEEGSSNQVNEAYWKKFNIWYRKLRYWRHNSVPHCIDFMHVEKNVCESLVGTLLNVPGKTKDGMNARLDLAELGIKPELFARQEEDKTTLPPAGYTLTNAEKDIFCETLSNIRVPQGYCSNFSSLVSLKDRKLIGLKSHDYHMLMQEFLPIAIRSIMHPPTRYAIIRFCFFFKFICRKEISLQELDKMQLELVVTLCLLEKFFPPSFFDIMIHLTVHLTREVKLCGPICFRWMYPFERCMKVIKGHVRNRNRPEGCIAEETIAEETIEFFSEYHKTMKTIGIPPDKHVTNENEDGKPLSADKSSEVSGEVFQKAHLYVIHNTNEIVPYIERHKKVLKTKNPGKRIALVENEHSKSFAKWLREEVEKELAISKDSVSETLR